MASKRMDRIFHELSSRRTTNELIETAARYMKNPLILVDLSLHILAVTQDDSISDPRWHELSAQRMMPMDLGSLSLYTNALLSGAPVLSTDSTGLSIVRCAVAQDKRLIAYLLCPCYHGAPSQEELDLLQLTADLASLRIQMTQYGTDPSVDRVERFAAALLEGTVTDEQQIRDRCRACGWRLTVPYRVLTIKSADPAEMEQGAGYLNQTERGKRLQRLFPDAVVFLYGEQLKLIVSTGDENVRERIFFHELSAFLEKNGLISGVSQPGRSLTTLPDRHHQAMKALQLGTLLMGNGPLYHYDRYSIYHALELCSGAIDLRELCHGAVLTLERYDRQHNTSYMGTLHAYLASGMNARETANSLYIHRNTLTKRLEKINDLITVDLSDRETVFHLMFSMRVIEYYGATRMRETFESWIKKMPTLRHR